MLRFNDLSVAERQLISKDIFTALHLGSGSLDPYDVVSEIFHHWGVMCIHPVVKRRYRGSGPTDTYRWFECEMCGCVVKNDEYVPRNTRKVK